MLWSLMSITMVCPGSAVSWNHQRCNRQSMQQVQKTWSIGTGLLLNALTHMFSKQPFFDSGRKKNKRSSLPRHWRQNQRLAFQKLFILPLSWDSFLPVTVLWIVWICDYFFADFLMVAALLVKICQMKLLKKVWCILLVLCTLFNSFSIQLEAHQVNKILMCENEQKPEMEPESWKKRPPEPELQLWKPTAPKPEAHSWKSIAPEAELCHFYDDSAAMNNPRCSRAHRRSRVNI